MRGCVKLSQETESLSLGDKVTNGTLYGTKSEWSLSNEGKYDSASNSVLWTHNAVKTSVPEHRRLKFNVVARPINSGPDTYNLVFASLGLVINGRLEDIVTESVGNTNRGLIVTNRELFDIFSLRDPTSRYLKPKENITYTMTGSFDVPSDFEEFPLARISLLYINLTIGNEIGIGYDSDPFQLVSIYVNEVANIRNDVTRTTGYFTNYNSNILNASTQSIDDTEIKYTSVIPMESTSFTNVVSLYTSNDIVAIDFPVLEGSSETTRYQFINVPDLDLATENIISTTGTSQSRILYSAMDWASNKNNILTSTWNQLYSSTGLVLEGTNGLSLKFTSQDSIASNLEEFNAIPGQQIIDTSDDPGQTEANAALAALLWLKLTLDTNPSLADSTFNSDEIILNLPPESPSGLERSYRSLDNKVRKDILKELIEYTLSSLQPSSNDQASLMSTFTAVSGITLFCIAVGGLNNMMKEVN